MFSQNISKLLTGVDRLPPLPAVAGLIHDIGKLVMCMALPDEFSKAIDMTGPETGQSFEVEKRVFGVTHGDVGMMLLKRWTFPEGLISAVGYHHHPLQAKRDALPPLVIHGADMLAHLDEELENRKVESSDAGERFSEEVLCLFRQYGFRWNSVATEGFLRELANQKERDSNFLELFSL